MENLDSSEKRSFLLKMVLMVLGIVLIPFSWMGFRFAAFTPGGARPREITSEVLAKIPLDEPYQDQTVNAFFLRRGGSEEVSVLDDRCTHLGCRLQWAADQKIFKCPCHGSEFDTQGQVLKGPATQSLVQLVLVPVGNNRFQLKDQKSRQVGK